MALYLPKFNLLYFHIYKTAGTSIRIELSKKDPGFSEIGRQHADVTEIIQLNQFEGKNTMAVVRNPYDWCYSLYMFSREIITHPFHTYAITHDFEAFLKWQIENSEKLNMTAELFNGKLQTQTDYLSYKGEMKVSNIFKMENLEVEINQYFKDFFRLTSPIRLGFHNKLNYQKVELSRTAIEIINDRFKEDFKNFNYNML